MKSTFQELFTKFFLQALLSIIEQQLHGLRRRVSLLVGVSGGEADRRRAALRRERDESRPAVAFVVARALPVPFAKNFLVVRRERVSVEEELTRAALRDDESESTGV